MDPIWYIGPPGDLRAITCPETNVTATPERYGGVHGGLSGARTMDVTGLRHRYQFQLNWLEEEEFAWLQALHYRQIAGPHRMINPLNRNRLTPESSGASFASGTARGATATNGLGSRVWDWPFLAGVGAQSTKWSNRSGTSVLRFDDRRKTTIFPLETITGSVWMKSSVGLNGVMVFDWFNRGASLGSSTTQVVALTTSWQRFTLTRTAPAEANLTRLAFYTDVFTPDIYVTAAQVEAGDTATDWIIGGGAPVVLVDQLEVVSPLFPFNNVTATILEA